MSDDNRGRESDIVVAIILLVILVGASFIFWRARVNTPPPKPHAVSTLPEKLPGPVAVVVPEPPPPPPPPPAVEEPPPPPPPPPAPPVVQEAVVVPPAVSEPPPPPVSVPNPGAFTIDIVLEKEAPCAQPARHAKSTKHRAIRQAPVFKTWRPVKRHIVKTVTCQGKSAL